MKTPITVLQEMMVKLNELPDYEFINQSGQQHQASFEYRCSALGESVSATARSKKEAKQEAARRMLRALAAAGHAVPHPYEQDPPPAQEGAGGEAAHSYVALLSELCAEYGLAAPQYELVADTGPPHCRQFAVRAAVALRHRTATASTKKSARQIAAHMLYTYLRENLARLTQDFVEEDALMRAHERAMERYTETREEVCRLDLGQKLADYHRGLCSKIDETSRLKALRVLEEGGEGAGARALEVLGLQVEARVLEAGGGAGPSGGGAGPSGGGAGAGGRHVAVLAVGGTAPALALAGGSPREADAAAARYLSRALRYPPASPL